MDLACSRKHQHDLEKRTHQVMDEQATHLVSQKDRFYDMNTDPKEEMNYGGVSMSHSITIKDGIVIGFMLGLWLYSIILMFRAWRKMLNFSDDQLRRPEKATLLWRWVMEHIVNTRKERRKAMNGSSIEDNSEMDSAIREGDTENPSDQGVRSSFLVAPAAASVVVGGQQLAMMPSSAEFAQLTTSPPPSQQVQAISHCVDMPPSEEANNEAMDSISVASSHHSGKSCQLHAHSQAKEKRCMSRRSFSLGDSSRPSVAARARELSVVQETGFNESQQQQQQQQHQDMDATIIVQTDCQNIVPIELHSITNETQPMANIKLGQRSLSLGNETGSAV